MANFFQSPLIPNQPNPEPPGYDFLRYLLMTQAMGQQANPYGLSPGGQANFGGFNQGNRPFNPYGQGYGPPGGQPQPQPGVGPQGMGQGVSQMPPQIMQLLQMLMAGQRGAQGTPMIPSSGAGGAPRPNMPIQRGPMPPNTGGLASLPQQPVSMPSWGGHPTQSLQTPPQMQPRQMMPMQPRQSGYDGNTIGYDGMPPPAQGPLPIQPPPMQGPFPTGPPPIQGRFPPTTQGPFPIQRPVRPVMPGQGMRPSVPPVSGYGRLFNPTGYDGNTIGYGGRSMGMTMQHRQPPNIIALMRSMGQMPRPHQMPQGRF